MSELLLDEPTIDAIATRAAAKVLAALPPSPLKQVLSPEEARVHAGFNSLPAFYQWAKRVGVRPLRRGGWSRRRLDVALGGGKSW